MGFSWSLFFCQRAVETKVASSGDQRFVMMRDREPAPDVTSGALGVAVYVDGVAVIGCDQAEVRESCRSMKQLLDECGLECGEVDDGDDEQVFTGLQIQHASGRISVHTRRLWRLRLALDFVLARRMLSGEQMRRLILGTSLVAHYFAEKCWRCCRLATATLRHVLYPTGCGTAP